MLLQQRHGIVLAGSCCCMQRCVAATVTLLCCLHELHQELQQGGDVTRRSRCALGAVAVHPSEAVLQLRHARPSNAPQDQPEDILLLWVSSQAPPCLSRRPLCWCTTWVLPPCCLPPCCWGLLERLIGETREVEGGIIAALLHFVFLFERGDS